MKENRLVIETLKRCISDILASGDINTKELTITLLKLEKVRDGILIKRGDTKEVDLLIKDIKYIKYDLL